MCLSAFPIPSRCCHLAFRGLVAPLSRPFSVCVSPPPLSLARALSVSLCLESCTRVCVGAQNRYAYARDRRRTTDKYTPDKYTMSGNVQSLKPKTHSVRPQPKPKQLRPKPKQLRPNRVTAGGQRRSTQCQATAAGHLRKARRTLSCWLPSPKVSSQAICILVWRIHYGRAYALWQGICTTRSVVGCPVQRYP